MSRKSENTNILTWYETVAVEMLYALVLMISMLPFKVLYFLSDLTFHIIYSAVGYRRRVVRKNLALSFPEKTEEERAAIERGFYHFFCDYIFETLKLVSISKERMKRHMVFTGVERVEEKSRRGLNIALYLGHYGNWEWMTSISLHLPQGMLGVQVYHVLESRVMDRLLLRIRSKMGSVSVPMAETLRKLVTLRSERQSHICGFISDQSPIVYNVPYWTIFLNQETPFINGTEHVARKLDMACMYLDVRRVKRGFYVAEFVDLLDDAKSVADGVITQRYSEMLEHTIRRQPELWLWSHNRWKRSHADFKNELRKKCENVEVG